MFNDSYYSLIWWMDVRYNFVYIFKTIFLAIYLSGDSNIMSHPLKMFWNIGE